MHNCDYRNAFAGFAFFHFKLKKKETVEEAFGAFTSESLKDIWREDVVKPSLSQEEALMNAKNTYNGFFVVPVILAEVAS